MLTRLKMKTALIIGMLFLSCPSTIHAQLGRSPVPVVKNMALKLELLSPISTETNRQGDTFNCKVLEPAELVDSLVTGHIAKLKRSGKTKGKSEIDLRFDTITMRDGTTRSFNADVEAVYDVVGARDGGKADNEGTVKGRSTVKRDVKRTAGGAVAGAILGGIFGGAKGAAIGAAIGGGVGASTTLITKGPDLEFKQGTQFTVRVNKDSEPVNQEAVASTSVARSTIRRIVPGRNTAFTLVPELPSPNYRTFTGSNLSFSVPVNWQEFRESGSVVFAPQGAYLNSNLTHGVIIGTIRSSSSELLGASEKYLNDLVRANTYLSKTSSYQRTRVSNREAVVAMLVGHSPVTGQVEMIKVVTFMAGDGQLFYINAVARQEAFESYRTTFDNILQSIQIKGYRVR